MPDEAGTHGPSRAPASTGWPGLHSVFDELSEGVWLASASGRILDASPALCRILGLAREHCVRRRIRDVFRAAEPGRVERCLAACRTGRHVMTETTLRGDRTRRLQLRFVPQPDGRLIGLVRDLTEQRRLEREIRLRAGYQEAFDRTLAAAVDTASPENLIQVFLRAIGECAEASRSYVFEMSEARRVMVCSHEWVAPGIEPFLGLEASYDDFPFWVVELTSGRAIVAGDISRDLPEELHEILSMQGILSLLAVPLRRQGRLWGFLGLDECVARREWLPLEADLLRTLGDLLTHLLTCPRPAGASPLAATFPASPLDCNHGAF